MKSIFREYTFGGPLAKLYCDISLEGRLIRTFECKSMMANFLRILWMQMCGDSNFTQVCDPAVALSVTGATNTSPILVTVSPNNTTPSDRDILVISGVGGNTNANGTHYLKTTGTLGQYQLYADQALTTPVAGNGAFTSNGTAQLLRRLTNANSNLISNAASGDDSFGILVGTDVNAVTIDDYALQTKILNGTTSGKLQYGAMSIAVPGFDTTTGQITLTRQFTNQSGSSITVTAVALHCRAFSNAAIAFYPILTRDLISPSIPVANGKTLTMNLRLKHTLGSTGGFPQQFLNILYRHLTQSARAALNTASGAISNANSAASFFMSNGGARSEIDFVYGQGACGEDLGVVVGTGTTAVAMSDVALQSKIIHGVGTGQFFHYGVVLDNFTVDVGGGQAYFDIVRICENRSGGSITVKELAIQCLGFDTTNNVFMLLRDVFDSGDWVAVSDGEFLKAVARLKIVL